LEHLSEGLAIRAKRKRGFGAIPIDFTIVDHGSCWIYSEHDKIPRVPYTDTPILVFYFNGDVLYGSGRWNLSKDFYDTTLEN
jgi:hypothetical protein